MSEAIDIEELERLLAGYYRMSGQAPEEPWNQRTYDNLVYSLIEQGPELIAEVKRLRAKIVSRTPDHNRYLPGETRHD